MVKSLNPKSKIQNPKLQNKDRVYELTLGYSCNSNCQFCSIEPQKRSINKTTREALNDILRAKQEGFRVIGFGGGEPTIRKDILELVRFAKKLGFETIRIQTNGVALAYENFCRDLASAGANFFKFSIHGHKPEIHDKLTRVPESFERAIKGLDNVCSLEVRREVDIVLNKLNYKFLPQFVEFFVLEKKVNGFVFIYPLYSGRMKENSRKLGIRMVKVLPYLEEALDMVENFLLDKGIVFNIPSCLMKPGYHKRIVKDFIRLKVNTPGLTVEDAVEDIREGKQRIEKCKNCSFSSQCQGIWKNYLEIFGPKEFN